MEMKRIKKKIWRVITEFNFSTIIHFFLTSNYLTLRFTMSEQNKLEVHGAGMVIVKVHSGS